MIDWRKQSRETWFRDFKWSRTPEADSVALITICRNTFTLLLLLFTYYNKKYADVYIDVYLQKLMLFYLTVIVFHPKSKNKCYTKNTKQNKTKHTSHNNRSAVHSAENESFQCRTLSSDRIQKGCLPFCVDASSKYIKKLLKIYNLYMYTYQCTCLHCHIALKTFPAPPHSSSCPVETCAQAPFTFWILLSAFCFLVYSSFTLQNYPTCFSPFWH